MSAFRLSAPFLATLLVAGNGALMAAEIQFIHVSDLHYGVARAGTFMGGPADAKAVNRQLVDKLNQVPALTHPADGGVRAGTAVGYVDFIIMGGDATNRHDRSTPPAPNQNGPATTTTTLTATQSWADFTADFLGGVGIRKDAASNAPIYLIPGNHEVSNAIGYYRYTVVGDDPQTTFATDDVPMMDIFRRMISPTPSFANYDLAVYNSTLAGIPLNRINYSRDVGPNGEIHMLFLNMWPDSGVRAWADQDLATVPLTTPVMIFIHDQPAIEAKHLTNPVQGADDYGINATNKFENLCIDRYASGGGTVATDGMSTDVEQRALVAWLKTHPNIVAYFHGDNNWTQFYDYQGPDSDITLRTYRVDSPIFGDRSSTDETLVGFNIAAIDLAASPMRMTVREVRWNPDPTASPQSVVPPVFSTDTTTIYGNGLPNTPIRTVPIQVAAPVFSLASGTYTGSQSVAITCATIGTAIYYTVDGSTPTLASTLYTGPIQVSSDRTVRALAATTSFASLAPCAASATYVIHPAGGSGSGSQQYAAWVIQQQSVAMASQAQSTSSSSECGLGSGLGLVLGVGLGALVGLRLRRRR